MKNQERLLRIFSDIKFIETNEIEDEKYMVCFHVHYKYSHYSCWNKENGCEEAASFSVTEDGIRLLSVGEYSDKEIEEMKAMFDEWLQLDSTVKVEVAA